MGMLSCSVVSDSLKPHGLQPARLLCPWGYSTQEYWSGLPCPPPQALTNPGNQPRSHTLKADYLLVKPPGKPKNIGVIFQTQELNLGSLDESLVAQLVKNPPAMWETWVRSLGWEDSLEEDIATHSSILAWRIPMDRRAWRATLHGVAKSWMQLSTHGFCLRTNDMKMVNGIGLRVYFWNST